MSLPRSCAFLVLILLPVLSVAQVTINGTGTGAFQCTEGFPPTSLFGAGTDVLWCDSTHWFQMNNNNGTSTTIEGIAGSDVDNTIVSSAVDSTIGSLSIGTPLFLSVNGSRAVTLNGGTTSFVAYINGFREVVSTSLVGPTLVTNTVNFIYLTQNSAPALGSTTLAPVYGRIAPSCSASSTPQYWFNSALMKMESCTNSGNYAATPVLFLGVIAVDNFSNTLIAHEPWHLNPATRVREFGSGGDAYLTILNSTSTVDGWKQYSALEITTSGILNHNAISTPSAPGLFIYSQNPVLVAFSGQIDLGGRGRAGGTGNTSSGAVGMNCGVGGAGGGGGGSAAAGSAGGNRSVTFGAYLGGAGSSSGGAAGQAGASQSTAAPPLSGSPLLFSGCGGGSGAGDGTRNGGNGGSGGGGLYLKAPSVVIGGATTVDADGAAGAQGTTGTGSTTSGGGGGGGGVIVLDAWFAVGTSIITANGGAGGAIGGGIAGHVGGAGGTGIVQVIQHQ